MARARVATARPPSARWTTQSFSVSFSEARMAAIPREPASQASPSATALNVSPRIGSWTAPAAGRPSTTSADRDAEERDPVGVVHGAVERVDDPGPARGERPRRRSGRIDGARVARPPPDLDVRVLPRSLVRPGLLGEDPVAGKRLADRAEDQLLGQVVDLGHHVLAPT